MNRGYELHENDSPRSTFQFAIMDYCQIEFRKLCFFDSISYLLGVPYIRLEHMFCHCYCSTITSLFSFSSWFFSNLHTKLFWPYIFFICLLPKYDMIFFSRKFLRFPDFSGFFRIFVKYSDFTIFCQS